MSQVEVPHYSGEGYKAVCVWVSSTVGTGTCILPKMPNM